MIRNLYKDNIYRIVRTYGGWCVAVLAGHFEDGTARWRRVSNIYSYRGWAQNYARRYGLRVQNYEGMY